MDIAKYTALAEKCSNNSKYFGEIGFEILSASFAEVASTITEMAEIIRKVAEMPAEEGANE